MLKTFSIKVPYTLVGLGTVSSVGEIAKDLGATAAFIITDVGVVKTGSMDKIKTPLEKAGIRFGIFDKCKPNAPLSTIEECSRETVKGRYDLLIGVGGGSVLDLVKVTSIIAPNDLKVRDLLPPTKPIIKNVIPKILIPTTAGTGSEWSSMANITDETDGLKKLLHFSHLWADAAIIDPELTLNLPQNITAETGMDVLAHAIEGYASRMSTIVGDMFAEWAIKMVTDDFRPAYAKGNKHIESRYSMAIAASLAMKAAEINGTGLGHFIDSFVVSKTHISHGAALTILLPHVMEFNLVAVPHRYAKIADLLGEPIHGLSVTNAAYKSVETVRRISRDMGMVQRLRDVGITEADIPQLIDDLFRLKSRPIEIYNPRNATPTDVADILRAAL
jgi:alcohol dehydrogenase class IV